MAVAIGKHIAINRNEEGFAPLAFGPGLQH